MYRTCGTHIDNATIYSSSSLFVPKGHAVLIVPKTRTTESYKSFLHVQKALRVSRLYKRPNLQMKLYILDTYIVYLWPPDSLCSSLEARGNVDAFLATRRGPTSLRGGAQYMFSSVGTLVVLIPYCANNSRATFGVGLPRYAPSLFRGRTLRLEQVV